MLTAEGALVAGGSDDPAEEIFDELAIDWPDFDDGDQFVSECSSIWSGVESLKLFDSWHLENHALLNLDDALSIDVGFGHARAIQIGDEPGHIRVMIEIFGN